MKRILALALVGSVVVVAVALFLTSGGPRTIAAVDHPDGPRVRVVQEFAGFDGFETTLYYDIGDGQWRWYYFDHDDSYWRRADAQYDGSVISVGSPDRGAVIDTEEHIVTITNDEIGMRENSLSREIVELPAGLD